MVGYEKGLHYFKQHYCSLISATSDQMKLSDLLQQIMQTEQG